ncbi:hypothetical protein A8W25_28010 [Streptomyces sp. ERV7]|uniref:hypothetical protein n=1 Tax=Streptomyces sp. ERV7 TaxID=1322334 RepID=UPI0007F4B86D|nr:hypothetical protein [Streptomyces sp. ERV7]OAR22110.1 hypothetical protein A8W25_28010 [Streptomyces sp. ERV7]
MAEKDKHPQGRGDPEDASEEDGPKTPDLPPPMSAAAPKPGHQSVRAGLRRRMRELDDRRAQKSAPDDGEGPDEKGPADEVEPEEPPD